MAPPPPPPKKFHKALSKLDMYRKVPNDLMEGTKRGSILSWLAILIMLILFILETSEFFTSKIITDLMLDNSDDTRLRINFNITMLDLICDYAVIDVVSQSGVDQNITTHITKHNIDSNGIRQIYRGARNKQQRDIELDLSDKTVTKSLKELHSNGIDAISLTEETLEYAIKENDYVFVDFYASWCSHCRDLAPTWESLAELMIDTSEKLGNIHPNDYYTDQDMEEAKKVEVPVMIGKVDCVIEKNLCNSKQQIRAYPTLRLFVDGQRWKGGDYRGHRTILEMVEWLFHIEEEHKSHMSESERQLHIAHQAARERLSTGDIDSEEEKRWHDKIVRDKKRLHYQWKEEDHPGCQLSGFLLVDRTPGNFHIQARSSNQEFDPSMTNVSHMVNYLRFGDPMVKSILDVKQRSGGRKHVPDSVIMKLNPMDGYTYVNEDLHESYHHYLKLVPTQVDGLKTGKRQLRLFQIMSNTQLSMYDDKSKIPEAKFQYDLSPISVTYKTQRSKPWYEYITSIMAIIGGVFTVVGMFESTIQATITTIIKTRSRKSTASSSKSKQHQAQQQESRQLHHNQYHGGS